MNERLLEMIKIKCYITDTSDYTTRRISNISSLAITKIKRLIGLSNDFDFLAVGNEEELELLLNYIWYAWNDSTNEFKENYFDDIFSLKRKHEVIYYEKNKADQL